MAIDHFHPFHNHYSRKYKMSQPTHADVETAALNIIYQIFYDANFDYDVLSDDVKAWCSKDEFTELCRLINLNRKRV